MKRTTIVLLIMLTLLPWNLFAQEQEPEIRAERLAIVPFVNSTDTEQWDNLASAMTDTIELTLKLSGQFQTTDVGSSERFDPYAPDGPIKLRRLAENKRLDAAIIGRITPGSSGRVELQTAVYSSVSGEIVGAATREAFGAFDILDAADELVVLTATALLGYEVGFGGIILQPSRPDVPYRVFVDGRDVGTNITSLPQILTGRRTVEVAVLTSGGEQYVYSADRLIRTGEAVEVHFGLPVVTSTEQRKIRSGHTVAEELLGRPDQFAVASRALNESRSLLMNSTTDILEPLRERQRLLETAWQLEEELYRLRPGSFSSIKDYSPGNPFADVLRSKEILDSDTERIEGDAVRLRVIRNGAALYYFLHIARSAALARSDWETAEAILNDMEGVAEVFGIEEVTSWRQERTEWRRATTESAAYTRRGRRPWPYIGLAAGFGGAGYGGYLLATGESGDFTDKEAEIVQWSSIAVGGVVAILSTWRIFHNRRAADRYLFEFAGERYGQEIALSERIFSRRFVESSDLDSGKNPDISQPATVLVLGPPGEVVRVNGQPRVFPFLHEVAPGGSLDVDRAPVVDADRTRMYDGGFSVLVLR